MNNIHNFTNRALCEYASIFPDVSCLLDHLLFTIGNGYDFDKKSGMIVDLSGQRIDEYPVLTDNDWKDLLALCYAKEKKWAEEYRKFGYNDARIESVFNEECSKYTIVNVDESNFTEDILYANLIAAKELRREFEYHRPYPLAKEFSYIFRLNEETPGWFVQIALNFCKAWTRFLDEELASINVWTSTGRTDKVKSDYADLTWTTRHRDMIAEQVQRLTELMHAP